MHLRYIILVLFCTVVASCASTRPKEATNYDNNLTAPSKTEEFIQTEKKVFDEPMLGVMLRYESITFPEDIITIYVYPISNYTWTDTDATLDAELDKSLKEVDAAIRYGHYKSRGKESKTTIEFNENETLYKGKKANFTITSNKDLLMYSDIYMFIAEDKFVKFRTSFDSQIAKASDGDQVVKDLLPNIKVPPESVYMKNLRAEHKNRMQQTLLKLIREVVENDKSSS